MCCAVRGMFLGFFSYLSIFFTQARFPRLDMEHLRMIPHKHLTSSHVVDRLFVRSPSSSILIMVISYRSWMGFFS